MKSLKANIAQYVERKDLIGLADYARAIVEDYSMDIEELELKHSEELLQIYKLGKRDGKEECNKKK